MTSNHLPPSLVSNLQSVLAGRKGGGGGEEPESDPQPSSPPAGAANLSAPPPDGLKPIVLVTNADGIASPGLTSLVDALVRDGRCEVHVCAPESDRSASAHSVTIRETVAASSVEIGGAAAAFEVSGTPADCVSLALSGALFSWSRPLLVISGINKGSSCGHHVFYSGAIAGAREALIGGVPSLSISWKKGESKGIDFKDAVDVCLPLVFAAIDDVEKGLFPKNCLLNIEIPTSPASHKGFRVTRQSAWRSSLSWKAMSANRHPSAGQFMSMHQSLGVQLAQLGLDASAAGAARRVSSHRQIVEIESVAAPGKPENQRAAIKKYFRLEFLESEVDGVDEDLDFKALDNGFVSVTPLRLDSSFDHDNHTSASNWLATAIKGAEEAP